LIACFALLAFHNSLNLMSLGGHGPSPWAWSSTTPWWWSKPSTASWPTAKSARVRRRPLGVSQLGGPGLLVDADHGRGVFAPLAFLFRRGGARFFSPRCRWRWLAAAVLASLVLALVMVPLMSGGLGQGARAEPAAGRSAIRHAPRSLGWRTLRWWWRLRSWW